MRNQVSNSVRFVELFAGIGGFRLALEKQGMQCVWANDIDPFACTVYRSQWNDGTLHEGDINEVDPFTIPDHELLVGGFPCQPFSFAGSQRGFDDTRGTLFFSIARILREKKSTSFIFENVKGILSNDSGKTFLTILGTLDELGYDVEWRVLNSKDFGVPQNRERVYITGHRRAKHTMERSSTSRAG
jgi:DNA (cytosine-5)-methyltransferase 1